MQNEKYTPQWLKDVLDRGFKPDKIYHDFDNGLFSYINYQSDEKHIAPHCRVYCLEGLPGAGKTTLLNRLKSRDASTVDQILPCEPSNDITVNQSFYLNSEELKTREMMNCKNDVCILDRYYVSTLAFYWAYDKLNNTDKYSCVYRWYQDALANNKIWQPFTTFYIDVNISDSLRRKNRVPSVHGNLWADPIFLNHFGNYYKYFYKEIEPRTKVCYMSGGLSLSKIEKNITKEIYGR